VSTAILWATALTMAINDDDDTVIRQLVDRLMERIEQTKEGDG